MAALSAFHRRYPGVRLSLSIGNSDEVLHQLLDHRSDVAIIADLPEDPRLFMRPLRRDHLIAFVERTHRMGHARRHRPRRAGEPSA